MASQPYGPVPGNAVMELTGRFDRDSAPQIRKDFLKLAQNGSVKQLEINFSKAYCADTSCLAVMVEVLKAMRSRGGELRLKGLDDNTVRMISLSRLDDIFSSIIAQE